MHVCVCMCANTKANTPNQTHKQIFTSIHYIYNIYIQIQTCAHTCLTSSSLFFCASLLVLAGFFSLSAMIFYFYTISNNFGFWKLLIIHTFQGVWLVSFYLNIPQCFLQLLYLLHSFINGIPNFK